MSGLLLAAGSLSFLSACTDDPKGSSGNEVVAFKITVDGAEKAGTKSEFGDTVKFTMAPGEDLNKLKGLTADIYISAYATINPLPSEPQDFSEPVTYEVKAQDGTVRKWVIAWSHGQWIPSGEGAGPGLQLWHKTPAELGIANSGNESSAAVCGDYLVFSRTGVMVDRLTGEKVDGKKLNMTGLPGASSQAFYLTNDDAGHLIGCTLPAIADQMFNIYMWTSADAAPQLLYSLNCTGMAAAPGRKLDVTGDITGDAIIVSPLGGNPITGKFKRWKVTGGAIAELDELDTTVPSPAPSFKMSWQSMAMSAPKADSRVYLTYYGWYVNGNSWAGMVIKYGPSGSTVANMSSYRGTFIYDWGTSGGDYWGNYPGGHVSTFDYNGKTYVAACGAYWSKWTYAITAEEKITDGCAAQNVATIYGDLESNAVNVGSTNATASITASPVDDGVMIYIYIEGNGVTCCKLSRYR